MKTKDQKIRLGVQLFFFILVGLIAVNHTLAETGASIPFLASASVHAICPFGGVETFYQLMTTGGYIQKIHSSALVLMGIVFTLTLLFGPVFCGWVCPLGSIQEWVGKLGKRILGNRYNRLVPQKLDRVLRYLRYVLLVLVLYNTARSGMLLFANVDPYYALFHFWTGETAVAALVILGVTLLLSLFVERAWCKYACPYGAMLGLFNPIRFFKIKRQAASCIDCGLCNNTCPMNIEVSSKEAIKDHQCISCLKCTSENSCPVSNTVQLMPSMKAAEPAKTKVKGAILGLIILVLMFGGIAVTSALGLYSTENEKQPNRIETGQSSGSYDPEDIRGSYTLKEISDLYEIEGAVLIEAFQLPEGTDLNTFKSKDIEALYADAGTEIGNGSLKVFVALYKNLPIFLADDYLPEPAVNLIIENNPSLTEEQKNYLQEHTYKVEEKPVSTETTEQTAPATEETVSSTPEVSQTNATAPAKTNVTEAAQTNGTASQTAPAASTSEEPAINGQITFQGVLDLGITKTQIEEIINGPLPATNLSVRTYCQDNGLSFSEVKAALNGLIE